MLEPELGEVLAPAAARILPRKVSPSPLPDPAKEGAWPEVAPSALTEWLSRLSCGPLPVGPIMPAAMSTVASAPLRAVATVRLRRCVMMNGSLAATGGGSAGTGTSADPSVMRCENACPNSRDRNIASRLVILSSSSPPLGVPSVAPPILFPRVQFRLRPAVDSQASSARDSGSLSSVLPHAPDRGRRLIPPAS